MKQSESIKEIAKAMSALRKQIKQPVKNADNPFFKSKYVMLEGVVKAIDEALPDGLSYTQEVTTNDNGVAVSTIIMHSSGEYMQFEPLSVPVSKKDAQAFGSAETYARRYTLSAVFGVTSDVDDDGNEAAKHPGKQQTAKRPVHQSKAALVSKPVNNSQSRSSQQRSHSNATNAGKLKTIGLLLANIAKLKNTTVEKLTPIYQQSLKVNFEHLTDKQSDEVIMILTKQQKKIKAEQKPAPDIDELSKALDEASAQNLKNAEAETAGAK